MKRNTSLWARLLVVNPPPQKQVPISCRVFVGVAFALVVLLSGSAEAVLTHYWNFEETDGTAVPQVHDTVGVNTGKFSVAMSDSDRSADVPSGIGSTRSLDFGTSNTAGKYVDVFNVNGNVVMPSTNDWTVSLWYKGTDSGGALQERVLLGNAAGRGELELAPGGYVEYAHYDGSIWNYNVISSNSVTDNVWHMITLVNHTNQTADLYVDGMAQVTGLYSATDENPPWQIGAFMTGPGTSGKFTTGKLDDVRIYDNALTGAEVFALFPVPVPEPSTMALLALAGATLLWRRRTQHGA